jgi:hypothetical protein
MSADTVAERRTEGLEPTTPTTPTTPTDAVERASAREHAPMAARDRALALVPVLAAIGWTLSLLHADPRQMGSLGLITLLNAGSVAALVLLAGGFLLSLSRNLPEWVLGAYLVIFIALVHATPAVLYGTLRYSWAFKHVGIVDYIQRTGTVDPTLAFGGIYHNWPGMFTGSALLTEIAGEPDALRIATWAPLAFNLMNLIVLRYVFRGLTRNRRLIWLGLWIFFVINWVGQDYFSPQAMVYVLYLAVIGLLLRRSINPLVLGTLVLLVSVVAASHQITPMMLLLAVTALVVLRRTPGWYLPLITGGLIAAWAFTGAATYTVPNLYELIASFGRPVANAAETLEKTGDIISGSEAVVVWAGRSVVGLSTIAALVGAWRSWRVRGLRITAVLLMVLPATLVLVTGFGGEVLFRSFLFAAPFIAFLAAAACLPPDGRGFPVRNLVATALLTALLLPGFMLSYYGKERSNYFTAEEIAASAWVDTHAPPDSLLIEGSRNYPTQFKNYERFTYVPIDREPAPSWQALLSDPTGRLQRWMSNREYAQSYLLLTRSQNSAVNSDGVLPSGALYEVESALRGSPDFRVAYENRDATVFTLSERGRR